MVQHRSVYKALSVVLFHLFLTAALDFLIEETEARSGSEQLAEGHIASEFPNQESTSVALFPHTELLLIWYWASISCQKYSLSGRFVFLLVSPINNSCTQRGSLL